MDAGTVSSRVADAPQVSPAAGPAQAGAQQAARRALRRQIARLDAQLGAGLVEVFAMRGDPPPALPSVLAAGPPRLLDLGELERVRDELVRRVAEAREGIARQHEQQAQARRRLHEMLLEPGRHRFERIALRELGEPGCGVWHVEPRLGLLGMLMGWWEVKLSSGCPLASRCVRC
jgi:hypothetical protein